MILGFTEFLEEAHGKEYHAYDIDETLFAHDHNKLRVHVRDKHTGEKVASLTNQQYNTHKLAPNHKYDFAEFRSSKVFKKTAKPIHSMISHMKAMHNRGHKVEMVTARQDLDNKDKFAHHMAKHGIDIYKLHVRRAGNVDPNGPSGPNKAKVISDQIKQNGYKHVHLYDDSQSNLDHFLKLKDKHPQVAFHAHLVQHDPQTNRVKLTTTRR